MSAVDPITLEVIRNGLSSIADEMALIIMRSAYSPVVRDIMDYSTGLCDPRGRIIAQGLTLPIQLCSFPRVMRFVQERFGWDSARRHPDHQRSLWLRRPASTRHLHAEADLPRRVCGLCRDCRASHGSRRHRAGERRDLRDRNPAGGLAHPADELDEAGNPNGTLFRLDRSEYSPAGRGAGRPAGADSRMRGGRERVDRSSSSVMARTSPTYVEALHDHAEAMMRETIRELPNGVYVGEDFLDGLGENPQPIRIRATVTIAGDTIDIDFSGTSDQVAASINCPISLPEFGGVHRDPMPVASRYSQLRRLSKADHGTGAGRMPLNRCFRPPAARGALSATVCSTRSCRRSRRSCRNAPSAARRAALS